MGRASAGCRVLYAEVMEPQMAAEAPRNCERQWQVPMVSGTLLLRRADSDSHSLTAFFTAEDAEVAEDFNCEGFSKGHLQLDSSAVQNAVKQPPLPWQSTVLSPRREHSR